MTTHQYLLDPDGLGHDEYRVCEICISQEINKRNDGLYGLQEWYNNRPALTEDEFIQVVETEFIRDANVLRYDSALVREHSMNMADHIVAAGHLDHGTVGVDDGKAYRPTATRRLELINTFDLLTNWDVSNQRKTHIKDELKEELGPTIPLP